MVLGLSNIDQTNNRKSCQIITNKSLEAILARKVIDERQRGLDSRSIFKAEDNRLVTVPIKEYSNKFLRDKRREEAQGVSKKKEPFPNSHLQNNRKLISEFKKYKGRNQKLRKSVNKENGEFIIFNLLFEKQASQCPNQAKPHKTIFGTFTQNPHLTATPQKTSTLIQKHFTSTANQSIFQSRKQLYQKICQKQKSLIPQSKKKCKTIADVTNIQDKRMEKISTSRALEKYSKIVKVNPEHGKIEKMRIKKELAKSLRLEAGENNQIQTKKIVLGQKHKITGKHKGSVTVKDMPHRAVSIDHSQRQNHSIIQMARTPEKPAQNFITSKVGLFTSAGRFKRVRKFSQQVESNKKCMTEQSKLREDETFGDFEINGWDINF